MSLLAAVEEAATRGEHDLRVNLLWLVASRAWWSEPGADVRRAMMAAVAELGDLPVDDARVIAIRAYTDPWGSANAVVAQLELAAQDPALSSEAGRFLGPAALVVGAFDLAVGILATTVDRLRTEG